MSGKKAPTKVNRKLIIDNGKDQSSETGEGEEHLRDQPGASAQETTGLERPLGSLTLDDESEDGNWLLGHPWNDLEIKNEPEGGWKMEECICMSSGYPVPDNWLNSPEVEQKEVDLDRILSKLPEFVTDIEGDSNTFKVLKRLVHEMHACKHDKKPCCRSLLAKTLEYSPQVKEILDKLQEGPSDEAHSSDEAHPSDEKFTAVPFPTELQQEGTGEIYYFDCEYVLKMYLPTSCSTWFIVDHGSTEKVPWIKGRLGNGCETRRWVFTPSYRRAKIALLKWPAEGDEEMNSNKTLRLLVVRPSEFDEYVNCCGHMFPIICLPGDTVGAGYPRYWIQKIALRLCLDYVWMIDDSLECFYEYTPDEPKSPVPKDFSFTKYRRRKFGLVLWRIEHLMNIAVTNGRQVAAISPTQFKDGTELYPQFTCEPPQIAVYLNIKLLSSKKVCYRPELIFLEDMIFGFECSKNGLIVLMDNRTQLQDWEDSGAQSPSVQS